MVFPTPQFAAFFIVVLWLSWWLMPRPRWWKPFMLAASYLFYGYADVRFTLLLAGVTAMNQLLAVGIDRARTRGAGERSERLGKALTWAAVAGNLAVLGVFKYYGFFVATAAALLHRIGLGAPLPLLQLALPVGVSFFTFQALSYVLDVHRGVIRPASSLDFAVYLAFFPHVVAGPIVRAREFLPQLAAPRDPRQVEVARALTLIAGGLVKKVVIADVLAARLVDPVFGVPAAHGAPEVLAACYGYAAQIFCDFSGYTDMATGIALLLGFQFPRNFDAPYTATSMQDFWRRWHMTLSRWLRDYLYIPLGGNRGGELRTYRNLALTMLLGGLWHGAAWNFVLWGGIHGAALAVERALGRLRGPHPSRPRWWWRAGRWLLTQHIVLVAWVFFRAPDLGTVGALAGRLWHWSGMAQAAPANVVTLPLLLAIGGAYAVQWVPQAWRSRVRAVVDGWGSLRLATALAGVAVLVDALAPQDGVAPFIYFRF
jgi:D-alanyl-lipoteichoic acid acyltransferase DltB (MBOAT superfamily)